MKLFADSTYSSGAGIPEGHYALEFETLMYQPTKRETGQAIGQPYLAVMVTFYPINEDGSPLEGAKARQKAFGLGKKAHESFAPSADGKGLDPIPGARFSTLMGNTNWALLRKSLVDCAPETAEFESFAELDGVWTHIMNQPEPEERKNFKPKTGLSAMEDDAVEDGERRGSGLVPCVTEILEGGKPWEGGGGIPEGVEVESREAAPKPAAKTPPAAKKTTPAAKPTAPAKTAPAKGKPAKPAEDDEDVQAKAVQLITAQLEENPDGMKRLALRTAVFKAAGDDAKAIMDSVFKNDDNLNAVLNQLGYEVAGADVKQQ